MQFINPKNISWNFIIIFSFFLTAVIILPSLYSYAQKNITTKTDIRFNYQTLVFETNSKPYGLSYGEWTSKWWQWAYSIPQSINPAYDNSGKYCTEGQSGPVWFLTSSYKQPIDRYCTIPSDKSILFTILNSECSYAEFPNLKTEKQLRQCAKEMQDSVVGLHASINGLNISDLEKYRIQSPLFNFTLPQNNILGLPAQVTTSSVSDGNWVFLKPLPIGDYIISFKGDLRNVSQTGTAKSIDNFSFAGPYGWDNQITYHLKIVNKNITSSILSNHAS
jgi:hypothetical protein